MARCLPWALLVVPLLPFIAAATLPVGASNDQCVYTVFVQTGSEPNSGTDSSISLEIGDPKGGNSKIADLTSWGGMMGPFYNYFEKGNLDIFSGRGPCLTDALCRLRVSSNGLGLNPSWFCEQIEVTMTGPSIDCTQTRFVVQKWLSILPPNKLAVEVNGCPKTVDFGASSSGRKSHFVIGGERADE